MLLSFSCHVFPFNNSSLLQIMLLILRNWICRSFCLFRKPLLWSYTYLVTVPFYLLLYMTYICPNILYYYLIKTKVLFWFTHFINFMMIYSIQSSKPTNLFNNLSNWCAQQICDDCDTTSLSFLLTCLFEFKHKDIEIT